MEKGVSISAGKLATWQSKLPGKAAFSRLSKSPFVRNILLVMTGTAVAQIIGFALSPIISRLFSPGDFGIFGSFDAVASIVGTVVTLQYSQAIILPREDGDGMNLLALSCASTFLLATICLGACVIAPGILNGLMKTTGIWALILLVLATLVAGINQSFQSWCVRAKAFKHTAGSQVVRSLSSSGTQLACGGFGFGAAGLVCSSVLADLLASVNLGRVVFRDWRGLRQNIGWQHIWRLAAQYRDFPMYSATSALINALSLGLPILLLTHFYGLSVAGAYAFAMRVLSTPMGFILTALRQVLLQKAAKVHNDGGELLRLYAKITAGLFVVAVLPALILVAWSPRLFSWIFGPQWVMAGNFASSLVVWLVFMFCNVPAIIFGRIIRIQRQMFAFDIALLVLRTGGLYLGGLYLPASSTIWIFAAVGGVMNIVLIIIVGYKLRKAKRAYVPATGWNT